MKKHHLQPLSVYLLLFFGVFACTDHVEPIPEPTQFAVSDFASGLRAPIGMVVDEKGQLWVSEAGTGNNDGSIVMITPGGLKTTVLTGFLSAASPEGGPEGLSHLYYENGKLYVLHGLEGFLYIVDVSNFKASDPAMALNLVPKEDIGTYVKTLNLTNPLNSNAFSLTKGPDGHFYIGDAGANAIIKRDKDTHALSLFAKIPGPSMTVDAVPTGIVFDGTKFLVSQLTGFPFASGVANVFQVTTDGTVSVHKSGFTTLTHLTLTVNNKPLLLHFGDFALPDGFLPFTGSILNEDGTVLLGGLMMPTDIKRSGDRTFYVQSYALGTIQKLTY
ncbi:ScyD/ScyE family protein [Dyadobacter pollutisoli]|uniref:ScyD/ScyE family protein n=1 Tax=Dyadobacter pollutisoli TaxID=2910158 RepID=A0A9E8SLG9_9BACT|nr:ScyD/ScyE family protein [Dyadobacter pollutisoli]WAC13575.1 ScyD/ScyE family protein [Dyadobacter pollutisoli]